MQSLNMPLRIVVLLVLTLISGSATAMAIPVSCRGLRQSSDASSPKTDSTAVKEKVVRVFVLAGQSNMQGHGVVDLDHELHYNGGRGTLERVMKESEQRFLMQHLKDTEGAWAKRNDVFVWYQTERELKAGPLSIGFSGYEGRHHFGPELQIGNVLGDAFNEPVLLIKTAWGGKSLNVDFRSPSSGDPGLYYIKMLEQLGEAMEKAPEKIPQLAGFKLRIDGFIWQQGWNDMVDAQATEAYASNLENFIKDVRLQFGTPELPFVYGELGNGGAAKETGMKKFRTAQRAVAAMKLPRVTYVETSDFARPAEESPNKTHGHHWYGNAESYFLVGDALGRAMAKLVVPKEERKRILILGDSISIGYTGHVRRLMDPFADVYRPVNSKGDAENCQGTDYGIQHIDRWLAIDGGNWDVIHFNFGLHDLKRVNGTSGKNSNSFDDPYQTSPEEYREQLKAIVTKLMATDAKLIFCTTTPVPEGVKPARATTDPELFNAKAMEVMRELSTENRAIAVNDLYSFANKQLNEIQQPKNVHFKKMGSMRLAAQVARSIRETLDKEK